MSKQKLLTLLAVTMAIILTAATVSAGTISYIPITGDEDSGIGTGKVYTHAIDFGNGAAAIVNGVVFVKGGANAFPAIGSSSQTVGTGNSTVPSPHGGDGNTKVTGAVEGLFHDMTYNDGTAEITLTGLTAGQSYQFRLYNRQWGAGQGTRGQNIGFDTDGVGTDIASAEDTAQFLADDASAPDPSFAAFDQAYALAYDYMLPSGVTTLTVYINNFSGGTYHLYGLSNEEVDTAGPEDMSPENGAVVDISPNPVTLSWTNVDPNEKSGATVTYVDVWFGTDPNKLNQATYTKEISGQNIETLTIENLVPGIYYWQVDSYLYGNPATVNYSSGDPCVVEGPVYMFTNDGPVAIDDMGTNMITWSGGPVDMVADVNDDGGSPLTYLWTANLPAGVTAEFDPSADVENPTVTFTRDPSVLQVANPGFEAPHSSVTYDGDYTWTRPILGWGHLGAWTGLWWVGTDPDDEDGYYDYSGIAPEGKNVAMGYNDASGIDAGFAQVLTETLTAGATYTLIVDVGHNAFYGMQGYKIQLLAGGSPEDNEGFITDGVVLAEDNSSVTIASDTFETITLVYTYDEVADANKVGDHLQIRLLVPPTTSAEVGVDFDNVRLTVDPAPAVSTSSATVTLTLDVSDETNPAVEDSMTIDVYDTACLATRIGLGIIKQGDVNNDCLVDTVDLALMALKWLDDSSAALTTVNKF